jgi:hypothetical protein
MPCVPKARLYLGWWYYSMDDCIQSDVYIIMLYVGYERYTWLLNVTRKETNGKRCFKQAKKE